MTVAPKLVASNVSTTLLLIGQYKVLTQIPSVQYILIFYTPPFFSNTKKPQTRKEIREKKHRKDNKHNSKMCVEDEKKIKKRRENKNKNKQTNTTKII